ncbi:unnamed protein product [Gongylonema pulchrum]|uniref:SEFIR domain-containing protein n=1 Tax=Gongylonema pulchrum TaxID=637853 RepID=A0A183DUH6_9BILA|nr:unnamed protein product [Gongylonema pulchrum]
MTRFDVSAKINFYVIYFDGKLLLIGIFDPIPNTRNEKLVACDVSRVKYWIGVRDAYISPPLLELLGLWGVLPIHPKTFIRARHNREEREQAQIKAAADQIATTSVSEEAEIDTKAATTPSCEQQQIKANQIGEETKNTDPNSICGECHENVRISLRNAGNHRAQSPESLYKFETDTQKCDHMQSQMMPSPVDFCNSQLLDVTFSSVAVLPNRTNTLPYVLLNISVRVDKPVSQVFLRLECLEAPNFEDDYCHNHEEQHRRWGRMIWPCRSLSLLELDLIRYPYHFSYPCFRLSAYSQYRLNVTLTPNLCQKSFIVTIPEEAQLLPVIRRFYQADAEVDIANWSPLAFVDLSLSNRQPWSSVVPVSVDLFQITDSLLTHLATVTISAASAEYRWKDVPRGNYTAYLYVNRPGCKIVCDRTDSSAAAAAACSVCPNTRIHFTVPEDKFWLPVASGNLPHRVLTFIAGSALLCFAILATSVAWLLVVWRRCRKTISLREISLSKRASVFLVYTDDCDAHAAAVATLAELLKNYANADVFLDQFELKSADTVPARWFIEKLGTAEHIVLIFSEGTNAILGGRTLIQRQPFPEFFPTAINFLISECNKDLTGQPVMPSPKVSTRFAFAYFVYSPPSAIPAELKALPVNIFKIPAQVDKLISWLHNQPLNVPLDIHVDISQLQSAINEFLQYRRENPGWLAERLQLMHEVYFALTLGCIM